MEARNTIVCIVPYLWGAHLDCWDNSHIKTPPHNPHHIHTFTSSRRAAFFASKAQEHGHKHSPARALIVHADHSVPFGSNSYTALIWRLLAGSFKADLQEAFYFFKGKEKPHLGDDGLKRARYSVRGRKMEVRGKWSPKRSSPAPGPKSNLKPSFREDWKFKWMTSKVITSTKSAQLERILAVALG